MGRVSLNSTTGTQFVNLNGDVLGWTAADQHLIDTVSGQFDQGGQIDLNALAQCATLLVGALDTPAQTDVNGILNLMIEGAPNAEACGYIIGSLADLSTINFARSLLQSPTLQALFTPERLARLEQIMTADTPAEQVELIRQWYQEEFADLPRYDTSHAESQARLNSVTQTGDTLNPHLIAVFDQQDIAGLKALILEAQANGTADQLMADIQVFGSQADYVLDQLMLDPVVGDFAFQTMQTMPANSSAGGGTNSEYGSGSAQQQALDAETVRGLLTTPASPAAIAHDYNTVAFRAHAIGQLVRNW